MHKAMERVIHPTHTPPKHAAPKKPEQTPEEKEAAIKAAEAVKAAEELAKKKAEPPTKDWVRKEMDLRASGHTPAERDQLNP
jgi:hypothetical protein